MKCKTCRGRGFVEKEFKPSANEKAKKFKEPCEACGGEGRIQGRKRGGKDKGFDWSIDD